MKLKLPPDAIFHHDVRLMVFRPRGVLSEKRIRTVVKMLDAAENKAAKPFNRFSDLSQLFAVDMDVEAILSVSLHRQVTYATPAPVKSAFYVTSDAVNRIAKIHGLVMKSSYLNVKVFKTIGQAARWLRVPKDVLAMDPADVRAGSGFP